jgi:undecaprenyl pyrophosphate phosphatase UppP
VRWRIDGTNPTSAIGHLAAATTVIELEGDSMAAFRVICQEAADATVSVRYIG